MDTTTTKQSQRNIEDVKVPPYSNEAEQSVLGGVMLESEAWDKISSRVSEADFYRAEHRIIFRVMSALARRSSPLDVLTVTEALKDIGELEHAGGEVYLFELAKNTPTAANVVAYANIVRERSNFRQLLKVSSEVADSVYHPNGATSADLINEAERKIFMIAERGLREAGPASIRDLLTKTVNRIDTLFHSKDPITGLSTGFKDLDDKTSGLQAGDLIIVAGRPSMGKTTFAMNIAENAAISTKKPVLVFSMEMPGESLAMRMMSSLGRIEQHKVRTGKLEEEDWPRITSAVSVLSEARLFIDDTSALSPADVKTRARRLMKEEGQLGLIVLDYLQLMQINGFRENRTAEISEISRSLKAVAKELNVPFVALSQLNRSLEQRTDRRPVMSDLRDSGSIEQDADLIMFIYRDEVYHENSRDKGIAEILIAKHRNGPTGKVRLTFMGKYTRFENFASQTFGNPYE